MKADITLRITDDRGRYIEAEFSFANRKIAGLKETILRTVLAQMPKEMGELFDDALDPETEWVDPNPKPKAKPKAKPPAKKPAAAKGTPSKK